MRKVRRSMTTLTVGALAVAMAMTPAGAASTVSPFVKAPSGGSPYTFTSMLTVGEQVPSPDGGMYQLVGIPDGMGAHDNGNGTFTLYTNHELTSPTRSEPYVGGTLNRGAIVSRFVVEDDGDVLSGERAYDWVYQDNKLIGPAPTMSNAVRAFARFCSATLAGVATGFDRTIFFTNEEEGGTAADDAATFDSLGGQSVAIFETDPGRWEAHALSRMGHFSKENTVPQPREDDLTVIIPLEDGPSTPDSQLYLYVGEKNTSPGASVLDANGLLQGQLYVFVSDEATGEQDFTEEGTSIQGEWVKLAGAKNQNTAQLEAASDAAGAFEFVRIEDGTFGKVDTNDFYFDTTGATHQYDGSHFTNFLGRLYHLELDPDDPLGPATLNIVYNADENQDGVIDHDIAISPDNLDVSEDYLMVQEDGTGESRPVMTTFGRDGQIWRFELDADTDGAGQVVDASSAMPVAELDGAQSRWKTSGGVQVIPGSGIWETSGIIDASAFIGPDAWVFDVQAHRPGATATGWPPADVTAPNTVEDGQLLLMKPAAP